MTEPAAESDERMSAEPLGPRVGPDIDFTDPNSRFAPYYLQASHIVALLLLVTLFLFFNVLVPLGHSDIWGHLKIGEWIVANGKLPEREMLSPFSDPLQPMANFQWLSQVVLYETYRAGAWLAGGEGLRATEGGVDMLRFLHALLEAAKGWFLLAAFKRWTGSLPFAIAGVAVVFLFSLAPSAIQRPQVFAEVLFAWLLWLLSPRVGPMPWKVVAVVAGVLTLWANLHGSFPIGPALIGVVWLGGVIESARTNRAALLAPTLHRPLIAMIAGLILLSLFNPHGWRAIPEVLAFAKNPNVLTMQEWRPLDFSAGAGGHWGYLVLLILITLAQVGSNRILGPTPILLLLSFGVGLAICALL